MLGYPPHAGRKVVMKSLVLKSLTLLGLAGCSAAPRPHHATALASAPPAHALWVWSNLPLANTDHADALFALAKRHHVGLLYQQGWPLQVSAAVVRQFAERAAGHGLQVALLLGQHEWVRRDQHHNALAALEQALQAAAASPIRAIHLDVEPHALPDWRQRWPELAREWLELLDKLAARCQVAGVALQIDVPAWWDARTLSDGERTQSLFAHALQRASAVTVMAYADTLPASLQAGQTELALGRALGKPVTLGVNLRCDPGQPGLCGPNRPTAEALLAAAQAVRALGGAGLALHDHTTLR